MFILGKVFGCAHIILDFVFRRLKTFTDKVFVLAMELLKKEAALKGNSALLAAPRFLFQDLPHCFYRWAGLCGSKHFLTFQLRKMLLSWVISLGGLASNDGRFSSNKMCFCCGG